MLMFKYFKTHFHVFIVKELALVNVMMIRIVTDITDFTSPPHQTKVPVLPFHRTSIITITLTSGNLYYRGYEKSY